ncbi:MAG: ROK family protein [Sandaracinaceae bacterium]|nr:ROK family protein [Sandaracinaceae bacterium]
MRLGVDLGGTKIEGLVLDEEGRERARRRIATPKDDAAAIVLAIAGLVRSLEDEVGSACTVGVGTPGSLSPRTGLLRGSNTTCLNGLPLDRLIAEALGREIRMANDANCFALSEAVDGAGQDARVVFGVIVGTGTGAGVVVDRRVLAGRHGIAGEWGHNPLPWPREDELPGPSCYCGKRGCIETWLSGPGFARDHASRTAGSSASAVEIAADADAGDEAARASLERYADRMARALATVIDVLDPDVIVLGGGMSNLASIYPVVRARLSRWVFSDYVDVPVLPAVHGDSGGVRGAAWLFG